MACGVRSFAARRAAAAKGTEGGAAQLPMREEMWMLCNLDEHLLFSQFRGPTKLEPAVQGGQPTTATAAAAVQRNPAGGATTTTKTAVAAPASLAAAPPPEPNGFAPSAAEKNRLGATPMPHTGVPAGGRVVNPSGERNGGGVSGSEEAFLPSVWRTRTKPPPPPPVKCTRRDERVTFYARPTCHDLLGSWPGGRTRVGVCPDQTQEAQSEPELESDEGSPRGRQDATPTTGDSGVPCEDERGGIAREGLDRGMSESNSHDRGGQGGGGGGEEAAVARVVAVGFKSGECAVLNATASKSPYFVKVLNKDGTYCEGCVTAIRFVPRSGKRLMLLAAFSTGDAYTFDVSLEREAPLGPAAEKETFTTASSAGGGSGNRSSAEGAGGSDGPWTGGGGPPKRRGVGARGGVSAQRSSQYNTGGSSSGSGGSLGKSRSNHGGTVPPPNGSSAPSLPTSFTAGARKDDLDGGSGAGRIGNGTSRGRESGSGPASVRGFLVEQNSVEGANPVSRWRVSSDGREVTDMAFAPCETERRRLVALAALDGVSSQPRLPLFSCLGRSVAIPLDRWRVVCRGFGGRGNTACSALLFCCFMFLFKIV